jgi:hypothetical protein
MKIKVLFIAITQTLFTLNCNKAESDDNITQIPPQQNGTSKMVSFNRSNAPYTDLMAKEDFGNIDKLREAINAKIVNNTLNLRLPKNTHSDKTATDGSGDGLRFNVDLEDGEEYELSFKVKFDKNFQFSRGGKIGPGLVFGKGSSGCVNAGKVDGASVRFMWYSSDGGFSKEGNDVFFQPYLYFVDQDDKCGETYSKKSVKLQTEKWYKLYMKVKSNTESNKNGAVILKVDNDVLYQNDAFRWTTVNTTDRLVNRMSFNLFRGGSSDNWAASNDGFVSFDDIEWRKIK